MAIQNRNICENQVKKLIKIRGANSHKGTHGHVLIVGGSYGKIGSTRLSAEAALRIGAGLVTVYGPKCANTIIQTSLPETMFVSNQGKKKLKNHFNELNPKWTLGIGPGMGTASSTKKFFDDLILKLNKPTVFDADALNLLATSSNNKKLNLPKNSILTPHQKEFERLIGKFTSKKQQIELALNFAKLNQCYLILKGPSTTIISPDGSIDTNTTGNAGLAKAGSGDVLTGILTGLLAQGYTSYQSCLIGVYIHGLCSDLLIQKTSIHSINATDIINTIGKALFSLK